MVLCIRFPLNKQDAVHPARLKRMNGCGNKAITRHSDFDPLTRTHTLNKIADIERLSKIIVFIFERKTRKIFGTNPCGGITREDKGVSRKVDFAISPLIKADLGAPTALPHGLPSQAKSIRRSAKGIRLYW